MRQVHTEDAPKAPDLYSQAVAAGPFLFISGQIPINPLTGMITGATITEQTHQVIDNLEAILRAENLTLTDVVRTEVFLIDMNDFQAMNEVYASRFSHPIKPTRQAMQVVKLPKDALVEISAIACLK